VGDDDFGKRLLSYLRSAKVDTKHVRIDPAVGSGMSVAIIDAERRLRRRYRFGSELRLLRKTSAKRSTSSSMPVFRAQTIRTPEPFCGVCRSRRPGVSQCSAGPTS
jgi:hypothetical protein